MKKVRSSQIFVPLFAYGLFALIGALAAFFAIFRLQSEQENAWFMGYSLGKILLGSGLLLAIFFCIGLIIRSIITPEWARTLWVGVFKIKPVNNFTAGISILVFLFGWLGNFLPAYRVPFGLSAYMDQLNPIFIWLMSVSLAAICILVFERRQDLTNPFISTSLSGSVSKATLKMSFIGLVIFLLIWLLLAGTGMGIRYREDYWYGPGVPVLGLQIFFSLIIGALVLWLETGKVKTSNPKFDRILFTLIWVFAALLWAREPLRSTYFMPGNAPLGRGIYPYSDSAIFDLASQFALIGQGVFNGHYFDRVLYSSFLIYLHAFAGQNTALVMTVQAVLFAVFPALIYLLGRDLHSRALGVSIALLIALRGANSIAAAPWIDLASPKMMLTDFPTAIGIAAFIYFVLKWFKEPSKFQFSVWAGAMLGLTFLLRTHVLLLLPVVIIYFFLTLRRSHTAWWVGSLILVIGMLIVTLPWDIRNQAQGTPPFYIYISRIETIFKERYGISTDTYLPPSPDSSSTRSAQHARSLMQLSNIRPQAESFCDTRPCAIVNHFLHNITSSVLIFPTSFTLDGLRQTVKDSTPYWKQDWAGDHIGLMAGIFLTLNLAFIALGISTAWMRSRYIGVFPLLIYFTYILTNALAFTSGGRYIVPVDWIICLYFLLGMLQVVIWGLSLVGIIPQADIEVIDQLTTQPVSAFDYKKIIMPLLMILLIGTLIPVSEMPFEKRYSATTPDEILSILEERDLIKEAGLDKQTLLTFLESPQAEIYMGRLLYPRYYRAGEGEIGLAHPYTSLDNQRLIFTLIGPFNFGSSGVALFGENPRSIPHASDVIVLGCKTDLFLDALVVFILTEPETIYLRSPQPTIECPFIRPD